MAAWGTQRPRSPSQASQSDSDTPTLSAQTLATLLAATKGSRRDVYKLWDTVAGDTEETRTQACLATLDKPAVQVSPQRKKPAVIDLDDDEDLPRPPKKSVVIDIDDDDERPTPVAVVHAPLFSPPRRDANATPPTELGEEGAVAHILQLFPRMQHDFARRTLFNPIWKDRLLADRLAQSIEHLLSLKGDWPKEALKRKRTAEEEAEEEERAKEERYLHRSPHKAVDLEYREACLTYLQKEFPVISHPLIRGIASKHSFFYSPTYEALQRHPKAQKPFVCFKVGQLSPADTTIGLERERTWFHQRKERRLAAQAAEQAEVEQKQAQLEQDALDEAAGDVLACGCCCADYRPSKMTQCTEAHLFCLECAKTHCETLLGEQRCVLGCIDTDASGCPAEIPDQELPRFLDEIALGRLSRIRQQKALREAGLDNLEDCISCDFACIIDNPNEKLFSCQNMECGKVFCRQCKEPDHLPKSCEELKRDRAENSVHKIEEAMSAALMRECPGCKTSFIRVSGCRFITCSTCGTFSCYDCRQKLDRCHGQHACTGVRHDEVEQARLAAAAEVQRLNPDVTDQQVDAYRTGPQLTYLPPRRGNGKQGKRFQVGGGKKGGFGRGPAYQLPMPPVPAYRDPWGAGQRLGSA